MTQEHVNNDIQNEKDVKASLELLVQSLKTQAGELKHMDDNINGVGSEIVNVDTTATSFTDLLNRITDLVEKSLVKQNGLSDNTQTIIKTLTDAINNSKRGLVDLSTLQKTIDTYQKTQNNNHKETLDNLTKVQETAKQQIAQLTDKLNTLTAEAKKADISESLTATRKDITSLIKRVGDYQTSIEHKNSEFNSRFTETQKMLSNAATQVSTVIDSGNTLQSNIDSVGNRLDRITMTLNAIAETSGVELDKFSSKKEEKTDKKVMSKNKADKGDEKLETSTDNKANKSDTNKDNK